MTGPCSASIFRLLSSTNDRISPLGTNSTDASDHTYPVTEALRGGRLHAGSAGFSTRRESDYQPHRHQLNEHSLANGTGLREPRGSPAKEMGMNEYR
jgi:hypothetical protein